MAYMVWGHSFLFGNTYVRLANGRKFINTKLKIGKIYGIKILNTKEKRESC